MNYHVRVLSLICCCAYFSLERATTEASPVNYSGKIRSNARHHSVDDNMLEKTLAFQPRSDTELEQFRGLTILLKTLIDRRIRQLERVSSVSKERAMRIKHELNRLRRYSTSLEQVMRRYGVRIDAPGQSEQQRDNREASNGSAAEKDGGLSKTVANGINQPIWLLKELRKAEQHRRRSRAHFTKKSI